MDMMDDNVDHNPVVSGEDVKDDSLRAGARNNFVRKVYSILVMQLLVTCGFVSLSMFNESFLKYQNENLWVFWVSFVTSIASLLVLVCVRGVATNSPLNVILLSAFTLAESYMVSMICSLYTPASVLNAAIATLGATIGLTLYAVKTQTDFSEAYSSCYAFFWSFFCLTTFIIILNVFFIQSQAISIVLAIIIGAVYSIYLIIDTQLIIGGRNQELSLDNYILGAAMLYIDIIQLFLQILRLLGDRR